MAPGWERWRAQLVEALTPVREWLIGELGLGNVEYRVIDAERIELDSGSVDGVLCQSTYMLAADPAAALAETRRVLRRGGRAGASGAGAPGVFSMASEERTRALLAGAGFRSVRTDEVPVRFDFRGLEDYEQWVVD